MGAHAVELFPEGARVLTHCNAGGLATGGYGTALGAVRAAWEAGRVAHVWVDETRPLLQGGRLTAWELEQLGIPHAVIADGAAASFMARGEVDLVVTGADRIAANGDTANKIGTYGLAVLAAHHGLPLVVVAPTSTLDPSLAAGDAIPIEERDGSEVTTRFAARNPAFDVTPGRPRRGDRHGTGRPSGAVHGVAAARDRRRSMILDDVDPETRRVLERFGFDAETFEALRARVSAGELTPASNVVAGRRRAACEGDVTTLPEPGSDDRSGGAHRRSRRARVRACRPGRARRRDGDALRRRREGRRRGGRRTELPLVEARRDRAARRGARRRDPGRVDDELPDGGRDARARRIARASPSRSGSRSSCRSGSPRAAICSSRTAGRRSTRPGTATSSTRSGAPARSTRSANAASSTSPSRTSTTSARVSTRS